MRSPRRTVSTDVIEATVYIAAQPSQPGCPDVVGVNDPLGRARRTGARERDSHRRPASSSPAPGSASRLPRQCGLLEQAVVAARHGFVAEARGGVGRLFRQLAFLADSPPQ